MTSFFPNKESSRRLSNEAYVTQNPALGAVIIWRAACGYYAANASHKSMPFQLSFTVIPIIFYKPILQVISRTNHESGLRKFAEKFAGTREAKQDLLLSIHDRCEQWRDVTCASLRLAFATNLLTLVPQGTLIPLTQTPPGGVPAKITTLLKNAEKLGSWYGKLSTHEIAVLLKIRF